MEDFEDFEGGWLPTLDFQMGVEEGIPKYKFYEKPMRTRWVTPSQTATSDQNKINWAANDLARRLLRV